jgi:7-cyano-7-deazaguanine synthase in queuosine biosynthesis
MKDEEETESLAKCKVHVIESGGSPRIGWATCEIGKNVEFSTESLASYFFAEWQPVVFDALLVAAVVEFCDKIRKRPQLGWGRDFDVRIPVHDPDSWNKASVSASLRDALQFLTGDQWQLRFVKRHKVLPRPQQGLFQLPASASAVIPFSEGLDSRAVSGLMAKELGDGLTRVRLGKKSFDRPKDTGGRTHNFPFMAIPYEVSSEGKRFSESSARTRGFKFALLSGVAAYFAKAQRIIVPESGQGALGPSLVPVGHSYEDYRNHPLFTQRMEKFLNALLGQNLRFEFPRIWYTKGETLAAYLKLENSQDWKTTRSCWQDNRHVSVNKHRRQCGICAACMLRRLSVHAAGAAEANDTYVWENLTTSSFEKGAASGYKKTKGVQRHYAIAGTLHLDHLAGLGGIPIYQGVLDRAAHRLDHTLGLAPGQARAKLDRLLEQHKKEWKSYMSSLGPDSFISNWTGGAP